KNRHTDSQSRRNDEYSGWPARAPYNFIPLNETVVEAEPIPPFNTYIHHDLKRYTGWIELDIEAKTPLYIRDTLTKEELEKQSTIEKENKHRNPKKRYINPDFFAPGGKLKIPGSSLRGMIRNLLEIVSFGKFGAYDGKRLYYRGLADQSNLRQDYQDKMSSRDKTTGKSNYTMSAGILKKTGFRSYEILPSDRRQIPRKEVDKRLTTIKKSYKEFTFYKLHSEYLVISGKMPNKKREWLIDIPSENVKPIPLIPEDVNDYKNDITRAENVPDLIKLAEKGDVPCFYTIWYDQEGQQRVSFGHTAMFRLAYEKTIGDHILPDELKKSDICDIAGAIFGNEKTFAGRVFFEDALLQNGQNPVDVLTGCKVPKILSSPKPTTFQHYLDQTGKHLKDLNHYNSDAQIRGNKLYWHKSGENWQEGDDDNQAQLQQEIRQGKDTQRIILDAIKAGTTFNGRIRFENLSAVELGALLFSLDLPEGCLHKLGMGKPLGLGSVKITPALYLSDREKRYRDLFAEWQEMGHKSNKVNNFKKAFEEYVLNKIEPTAKNKDLWEIERLQELKYILDYEIGVELERRQLTRYMEIQKEIPGRKPENEFKKRPILQKPSEIVVDIK
ncbi:MAG: TIGR03986 family CRISPR-associated RAMP protein, partial [Candidatus Vecturithrix sp.]|nr:TIGR03986 family CRISPR-associated RAMP protein [Candidatus Vecturithrix sp.]